MIYIIQSWVDSLAMFKPKNIKLFLLVTLKAGLELLLSQLYFFWWWLLAGLIIFYQYAQGFLSFVHALYVAEFFLASLIFIWFVLSRPSVLPKGYIYFRDSIKKCGLGFIGMYFLMQPLRTYLFSLLLQDMFRAEAQGRAISIFHQYFFFRLFPAMFFILPPVVFVIFFYFDSDGGFRSWLFSFVRGFLMYIYNLPFCIIWMIGMYLFWYIIALVSESIMLYGFWLIQPFLLSWYRTLYIKRVHDQFNLYFARE